MVSGKRVAISTLFGFIAGILCILLGRFWLKLDITLSSSLMVLFHRALIGFVIGISALRIHWLWHGLLIGLIVGIPAVDLPAIIKGDVNSGLYLLFSPIWGVFIELFTSVVFKAKAKD
jgi:hypothetical protein